MPASTGSKDFHVQPMREGCESWRMGLRWESGRKYHWLKRF